MIKPKKIYQMILIIKMVKRKENLDLRDHPVLVYQAVVVKVKAVMIQTINTDIENMTKLNQNHWTKKLKQIVSKENGDHVLETDQSVVGHVQDTEVIHVQDTMIEGLHIVIDQDVVDHQYHVMEVLESIRTNVIVHLVQMNQEVLNIGTDDNILVK